MKKDTNASDTTTAASAPKKGSKTSSQIGAAIVALGSMKSATYGRKPTGKAIACRIALEKEGVIRPIAERIETGLALTEKSYRSFKAISKGKSEFAEGAGKVITIANELMERNKELAAYKAGLADAPAAEAPAEEAVAG